jgi:hypothetical protein
MFLLFQRATLAEKEVSALKEQLATANQNLQLVESKGGGGGNKPPGGGGGDMEQNTMDIISRSGLEIELAAKEKEVSSNVSVAVSVTSRCKGKGHPCTGTEALYRLYGPQVE